MPSRAASFRLGPASAGFALLASTGIAQEGWPAQREFLERRCVSCHSDEDPAGGFDLVPLLDRDDGAFAADPAERPSWWTYLAGRVERGEMPPDGARLPTEAERSAFLGALQAAVRGRYDPGLPPAAGAPVVRRLTREEVARTVRDVLGVEVDVDRYLPAESVALGFDNVGSAQTLSPSSVEGLLRFAEAVAREAILWDDPDREVLEQVAGGELDERGGRLSSRGTVGGPYAFPRPGNYRVHVRVSAEQAGPELARFRLHLADKVTRDFEVQSEDPLVPDLHTLEFGVLAAAQHPIEVEFLNDYYEPEAEDPGERDRNLVVHSVAIEGPLGDPILGTFQRRLFERFGPDLGEERARRIVEHLALRLWRRPADPEDLGALLELVPADRPVEERVSAALEGLLASPRFHLRLERDEAGTGARELDGYERATRLAAFLWSSAPDEVLLEAAGRGDLDDVEALAGQVHRMLLDPRSSALSENFAPQWLALTPLAERSSDSVPSRLLRSMRRETELLFEAVLREGRPVRELLVADFTFVDDLLDEHYGLPGDSRAGFRRVSLGHTARRGVLGHAGVLTVTSDPGRTSPVLRGKWILGQLLGAPPPPPPDDVPALEASGPVDEPEGLRSALAAHRAEPSCAACHATIDPLGFALEGFDERGRRRVDAARLDLTGVLPSGGTVVDLAELSAWIARDERFVRTLLEGLAVYALGRPLAAADRGWVARVLRGVDPATVTLAELVEAVVRSTAFHQRSRIESP